MTELRGGVVRLVDSPVRYMRARMSTPQPRLGTAFLPVAVHLAAASALGVIITSRTSGPIRSGLAAAGREVPEIPAALGSIAGVTATVLTGIVVFCLHIGAVVAADVLFSQSGRYRRLIEMCAVSYWAQVAYIVPVVVAVGLLFDPVALRIPASATIAEVEPLLQDYMATAGGDLQVVLLGVRPVFDVWLVALHAAALYVASDVGIGVAWAVAIVLVIAFVLGPALI